MVFELGRKKAVVHRHVRSIVGHLVPVVQKVASTIHWMNHYPLDGAIGFAMAYPLDSDLSGG